MSSKVKIVLNSAGVRELLQSPEMEAICRERAEGAAASLGNGYSVSTYIGRNRVNASIYANSYEAIRENMDSNTILKALR